MKFKTDTKLIDVPDSETLYHVKKALIGFCGGASEWGKAVSWLHTRDGRVPRFRDVEFMMLSENGIHHSINLLDWITIDEPFFAIGSGGVYAAAAMHTGCSTEEAIATASRFDPYTGMGCKSLMLE